jgi:hypothetical protein
MRSSIHLFQLLTYYFSKVSWFIASSPGKQLFFLNISENEGVFSFLKNESKQIKK